MHGFIEGYNPQNTPFMVKMREEFDRMIGPEIAMKIVGIIFGGTVIIATLILMVLALIQPVNRNAEAPIVKKQEVKKLSPVVYNVQYYDFKPSNQTTESIYYTESEIDKAMESAAIHKVTITYLNPPQVVGQKIYKYKITYPIRILDEQITQQEAKELGYTK